MAPHIQDMHRFNTHITDRPTTTGLPQEERFSTIGKVMQRPLILVNIHTCIHAYAGNSATSNHTTDTLFDCIRLQFMIHVECMSQIAHTRAHLFYVHLGLLSITISCAHLCVDKIITKLLLRSLACVIIHTSTLTSHLLPTLILPCSFFYPLHLAVSLFGP